MPTPRTARVRRPRRPQAVAAALFLLSGFVFFVGDLTALAGDAACPLGAEPQIVGGELELPSGRSLRILAIGSSSTEGVGASSKDRTYPARLAALVAESRRRAEVRNAGIGGEICETTLARLKTALVGGWPQLVLWQVGTNDAMTEVAIDRFRAQVVAGVEAARAAKTQIVLIDPQFSAPEATTPRLARYAEVVDAVARAEGVPALRRYAAMRDRARAGELAPLLSADGLHMSDAGYDCLAGALAKFIAAAEKGS